MERTHMIDRSYLVLWSFICLLVLSVGTALGVVGDTPHRGGTLRWAIISFPTLDPHATGAPITWFIATHFLEGLYTTGRDGGPIPMLAAGQTVSDDGLLYTITLRRGVPFHRGKELTAGDVVPSLRRWGRKHPWGRELFARVDSAQSLDKYTVQLRLKEKSAMLLPLLMWGAIYPKEVVEEAGDGEAKTHIGTGPFQLADHQPQRSVELVRFERYQARPEPPYGYGGGKTAWLDTLLILRIPDDSARVAAVESGEVDATVFSPDAYDRLKDHPSLKVYIGKPFARLTSVLNQKRGVFTNVTLRQAALAALDMEPILRAAVEHPEFYRLDASLWPKEEPWWTDVGRERYNQKNPEKARRLLKEAGYQGEPVRYLVPQNRTELYRSTLMMRQQLEEVGFVIDLQVVPNWAMFMQRQDNPDLWDAFTIDISMHAPDPTLYYSIRFRYDLPGWNCDPDVERLLHAMATERRFERRYRLWQDLQRLFYERVPAIHHGWVFMPWVMRNHVHGPFDMFFPYFWNVWVEK
jgi:peptide/nickel transport system substrate-binding protein